MAIPAEGLAPGESTVQVFGVFSEELNDRGGAPIWQDSLRRPFNPPALATAVSDTANLIASHLSESVAEAEHH